jgi:hypothetical protein
VRHQEGVTGLFPCAVEQGINFRPNRAASNLTRSRSDASLSWCFVLMCLITYFLPTKSLLLSFEPHLRDRSRRMGACPLLPRRPSNFTSARRMPTYINKTSAQAREMYRCVEQTARNG